MVKKITFAVLLLFSCLFFTGCNPTEEEDEVITYSGLEEAHIYLGNNFDFFDGVNFTSTTQGDITSTVQIVGNANLSHLGVYIVSYQTHYQNNELYSVDRRIVVLNAPFTENDSENMLDNGDFSNGIWGVSTYADYPSDVQFILDPDLKRMQTIINSASTFTSSPNLFQSSLNLHVGNTYEIYLLVSGTDETFFTIDIVELNETYQVLNVLLDKTTVNVGLDEDEDGMELFTITFTPLVSSTNATFRMMFGQDGGNSPSGIIFIDNVKLEIIDVE